ncbi:MAG: Zn-dependent hydrolase [Anaerolineales bacterium]|nr:Zn-dependent hydrolase [Anaerolineales bacterium]
MNRLEFTHLRINAQRFKDDFQALAQIGATAEGGVDRPTFSEAHLAARHWFCQRILEAELMFREDGAGNHMACLACAEEDQPSLLLGSHLDSVPKGGRYDGALGVLAALEVLRTVKQHRLRLRFNLEAIDFTDEEGTLFGLLGSAALAGQLKGEDLVAPRGGRDRLLAGLERAGLDENGLFLARRDPQTLAGYLELHIEQGRRLLQANAQIGNVTSIVGIASYRLIFTGRADHAGTTPLDDRLDAALGASAFTLAARQVVMEQFPDCTVNVGALKLEPGAYNIVPERAVLSLEFRAADAAIFDQMEAVLLACAQAEAQRFGLGLEITPLGKHQPALMSKTMQQAISQATETLSLRHIALPSGAGHDAQSLAGLCSAGMIFIPSIGGASHAPREFSEWEDCINGANVLLQATLSFAQESIP